jgi:hypothetical protein
MEQRASIQAPVWIPVYERLPEPGRFVRYRTKSFSAAGHCDANGIWTDSKGRAETIEVMAWLEQPS